MISKPGEGIVKRPSSSKRGRFNSPEAQKVMKLRKSLSPPHSPHNNDTIVSNSSAVPKLATILKNKYVKPHIVPPGQELPAYSTKKEQAKNIRKPISSRSLTQSDPRDDSLNTFLTKASVLPLFEAFESFFKSFFQARQVIYWQEVPSLQQLFSSTLNITNPHLSGIVGYSFFSRSIVITPTAQSHPSYHHPIDGKLCPLNSPVLVFPIWDYNGSIFAIIEVIKPVNSDEFSQDDEAFVNWFTQKYKLLSKFINKEPKIENFTIGLMNMSSKDTFIDYLKKEATKFFQCEVFEIWKYNSKSNEMFHLKDRFLKIDPDKSGIVGNCLIHQQMANCVSNRFHPSYDSDIDGIIDEAILALPFPENSLGISYCMVLRHPLTSSIFSPYYENLMRLSMPYIISSLNNYNEIYDLKEMMKNKRHDRKLLDEVLNLPVLLSKSKPDNVKELIMQKCAELTLSDRYSLFLLNETHDKLVSVIHSGINNSIEIPVSSGIVGNAFSQSTPIIVDDVYDDIWFEKRFDLETGYHTRSILAIPIMNSKYENIGVIEMLNKKSGKFDMDDIQIVQSLGIFISLYVENGKLYNEYLESSNRLRQFYEFSSALHQPKQLHKLMADILHGAKNVIGAERSSLYNVDDVNNQLKSVVFDGTNIEVVIPLSSGLVSHCVKVKDPIIVNDVYNDPRFNRTIDISLNYKTNSLLAIPIISSEGQTIGAVELVNKKNSDFNKNDMIFLASITSFISLLMQNYRYKENMNLIGEENEIDIYLHPTEKKGFTYPKKLMLNESEIIELSSIGFNSTQFNHFEIIKRIYYIFYNLGLLEAFRINNEMLFKFIISLRNQYINVPFHNWIHAFDVMQYMYHMIKTYQIQKILTPTDIFVLIVASLCHDVNHNGYSNLFNEKSQTPYGILYYNLGVMEMHHIAKSIDILSREDTNLFHSISGPSLQQTWVSFISIIKATDNAHHFLLIEETEKILAEGSFMYNNPNHKILFMKLLIKAANISGVSRPFDMADKWYDMLMEELFNQGDKEKLLGIGLSSHLNDRSNNNKPKTQVSYYNFVCIPLYKVISKIIPSFEMNLNCVLENLEKWKALDAEKEEK